MVLDRNAGKAMCSRGDGLVWVVLGAVCARWEKTLVIVQRQTMIGVTQRVLHVLALEMAWRRRVAGRSEDQAADSSDVRGQFDVGQCPHSWRAGGIGSSGFRFHPIR